MNKYYKFYECCKITKGANRTAIYDLQRLNFYFVPNTVMEVFLEYEDIGIDALFRDYKSQKEQLEQYYQDFLSNEIIFLTHSKENFPAICSTFNKPLFLDFLFIEIDSLQKFKENFLKNEIDRTGVEHIILLNSINSVEIFGEVLDILQDSRVKTITLISKFFKDIVDECIALKNSNARFKKIVFYDSFDTRIENKENTNIKYYTTNLDIVLTKRISSVKDLNLNMNSYLEAINRNLFFNRRAYIKNNGEVKPSYVDPTHFGNIENENLREIVYKDGFQLLWYITKDKIEVCKDCEFRYMCPDNRIPLEHMNGYIHKTECNYSPYTNTWK